jgi:hypothetical protein
LATRFYEVKPMANPKQLKILKLGVEVWNKWREDNPDEIIDLSGVSLQEANLPGINLRNGGLWHSNLSLANLNGACLISANLLGAHLYKTQLKHAEMQKSILVISRIVKTDLEGANLDGCSVYGASVWNVNLLGSSQENLIITQLKEPVITVDNLEVAQFVYLLLNNSKIRDVLNTLTTKAVLILGRFALPERKAILDALRNKLREYDLLPIVFDFERPTDKDFTETIKTLAGMCYFVIADVTNPKSSPLELQATVPDYQIPFVPIIQEGERPFAMMVDLQKKYDWVLDTISYKDEDQLIRVLKKGIIDRAMQKHDELKLIKAQKPTVISASQFEE